jgi:hypothetical protein
VNPATNFGSELSASGERGTSVTVAGNSNSAFSKFPEKKLQKDLISFPSNQISQPQNFTIHPLATAWLDALKLSKKKKVSLVSEDKKQNLLENSQEKSGSFDPPQ